MGGALSMEGVKTDDENLVKLGNILVLLSGLVTNDEELKSFSKLAKMFSANIVLNTLMNTSLGPFIKGSINDIDIDKFNDKSNDVNNDTVD